VIAGENQGPSEVENAREWQSFENIADPEDGGDGRNYPGRAPRLIIYYGGYDGDPIEIDRGISSFAKNAIDVSIIKTGTATDEDDPTITFNVSSDDAEQENDEIDALNDDDIDAGWEGEEGDANILTAGLRFQNVGIPKGSIIDSAFFVVVSHEAKSAEDVAELTIYAEDTDDAQTFTEDALITSRTGTTAQVKWIVDEEWGLWTTERSVDIKTVVQEIVNREGWVSGNSMAFIITGEDQGPSEVENAREWQSFENIADPEDGGDGRNYPERAPRLIVYYGGYEGDPIVIDRGINSFAALSVADNELDISTTIYPNPATDLINLVLLSAQEATISLTNMDGKLIKEFSNNGLKEIKINLSYLQEGIYVINVNQSGASFQRKFIVK
ncbi:MAG: T9SS type A sorting domain-containing protein, partial [Bacteroidota bacterium]